MRGERAGAAGASVLNGSAAAAAHLIGWAAGNGIVLGSYRGTPYIPPDATNVRTILTRHPAWTGAALAPADAGRATEWLHAHGCLAEPSTVDGVIAGMAPKVRRRSVQADGQAVPMPSIVNARDLAQKPLPPLRWAWREYLPQGLSVLGGPPKLGKSWLCYQLGLSVARGAALFGQDTEPADVLMLALEDGERRTQERLRKLGADDPPERLHFAYDWPRMDQGGAECIADWCVGRENPLVIIDTLAKLRPPAARGANAYEADYAFTGQLHRLSQATGATLVAVMHMRKGGANDADWVEGISGSVGNVSAADTILALKRPRGDASAFLHVTGRDVAEQEVALRFEAGLWSCLGDAAHVRMTEKERAIFAAMASAGAEGISPSQLADAVPGMARNTAKQALWRMAQGGRVRQMPGGRYVRA